MGSGMNTEQAKEYAKTMTYSEAVSNVRYGKYIKYRKATMIKLRELAEIADRLDRKTEPQIDCIDCKYAWWNSEAKRYECMMPRCRYKDEPQTEMEKSGSRAVLTARCLNCHNAKACKENHWEVCRYEPWKLTAVEDEPQTDCAWK